MRRPQITRAGTQALPDDPSFRAAVEPLYELHKDVRALFQLAVRAHRARQRIGQAMCIPFALLADTPLALCLAVQTLERRTQMVVLARTGLNAGAMTGAAFLAASQRSPVDPKVAILRGTLAARARETNETLLAALIHDPPAAPRWRATCTGVSILELTLVVAMRQLRDQRGLTHFNFEMV